jgi:NADPH-dependent 2,4-dienoyl-CoA reductase/sulfur reductase-like enzyme/nitrite reductase/ring-hydroxylating ferredoxin subunit
MEEVMTEEQAGQELPDLTQGIASDQLPEGGRLVGRVGKDQVLLLRRGQEIFAIGAHCTHYHAPLADGLVDGHTIRCPWHHACFDLRTGEALHAPAFIPAGSWTVGELDGKIVVGEKRSQPVPKRHAGAGNGPGEIVIVGGGAVGFAAAEMLRREGYGGRLIMLSRDHTGPVDRPNLSKDYLAGSAPEEWVPLKPASFYAKHGIELRLNADVKEIDVRTQRVVLADGSEVPFDRLLLATGAEPVKLSIPGAGAPDILTLRSFADCQAIIARAASARRVLVLGASFIGLEVAAALRARNLEVHVAAPDRIPMERVLGAELGGFVRSMHEAHGVIFHLEDVAAGIDQGKVHLKRGGVIEADFAVAGVGVRPRLELAEKAGLRLDRGVAVNAYLETSVTGIYAAGDIARWPDPHSGENIRVEHWVVAERQGQTAARNMLGYGEKFTAVPFFWSQHYDVPINYVGHAEKWDQIAIDGDIGAKDCLVSYKHKGRLLAVASIFRDLASLQTEAAMERALTP